MSDDLYSDVYDDDSEESTEPQGGGLRQFAEAQKRQNEELRKQIENLQAERRQEKLADTLKASGVNPKVAALVPADVTPDKVGDWLTQYGDVFGVQGNGDEETGGLSDDEAEAIAAVSGDPGGAAPTATKNDLEAIQGIEDEDAFWKAIRG